MMRRSTRSRVARKWIVALAGRIVDCRVRKFEDLSHFSKTIENVILKLEGRKYLPPKVFRAGMRSVRPLTKDRVFVLRRRPKSPARGNGPYASREILRPLRGLRMTIY